MIGVLEVGGTHVTAGLIDLESSRILERQRTAIDSSADARTLLDGFATVTLPLVGDAECLVVAIPGPFNYDRGIGDFEGVGKFAALRGVDVKAPLSERLGLPVAFVNDVTAYAMGEYLRLGRPSRMMTMTLGTGVGSAFLADGEPVIAGPSVPQNGWIYTLDFDGKPIEETFSRRAIRRAYFSLTARQAEVSEIATAALDSEGAATSVFQHAYNALAITVTPYVKRFRPEVVTIGGSIARSWELVTAYFLPELRHSLLEQRLSVPTITRGSDNEEAALMGAALYGARWANGLNEDG